MVGGPNGRRPRGSHGEHDQFARRLGTVLAETIGGTLSVDPGRIARKGRGDARTAFARHVAIYLACTRFGVTFTEAGRIFGRDRTTAAYACRRIEEARDGLRTDRLVEQLDRAVSARIGHAAGRERAA